MILFELGFRVATSVFSKEGVSLIVGALLASFIMLHSTAYNDFILNINNYVIHLYYLILGHKP